MTISGIIEERVAVPQGVKVAIKGAEVSVSGKAGQLKRSLASPRVKIRTDKDEVVISCEYPKVKEKALVGTFASHIQNMIDGVQGGFEYHMKMVYSHFPMKATVKGEKFVIENFLGEKSPRYANIVGHTKISVKGAEVVVSGVDLEATSQTAANIERACRIKGYDPRVFQDGIYIVEKARKVKA
ncbi:MAG: 50S ribosomal protein L6 [Methanomassiliicoccales archaeon]|jgi:large subunit ribosomal protein L6|nr:50S ribosomal protein L6 [Methanomassiliicoccales archaeon]